ncbi:MAG: HtaA domain-containing protein [Microthrixaceae bacterium]
MNASGLSVLRRRAGVLLALALLAAVTVVAASSGPASADPLTITGASFRWRINPEVQGTSPFGECNYLSAGRSDGSEASYRATEGEVAVVKAGGTPTWATKCLVNDQRQTDQELVWTGGTGSADPDTGEVTVSFEGAASIVFYGGLLPFTIVDPVITIAADGTGTMVATMEGFASSLDDPHTKTPIDPVPGVVVADVSGVDSDNDTGFVAQPVYGGVTYDADRTVAAPQVRTVAGWGAWPRSYVDFHMVTGLSSYWYTSGGAFDAKKPPLPFQVTYDGIGEPLPPVTSTTRPGGTSTTTTSHRSTTTTTVPTPAVPGAAAPTTVIAPGTRTIVYRTVGGTASSGTSAAATTGRSSDTTTGSPSGALSWSIPADGAVAPSGDELGPIAIADTRAGGHGWTLTGRLRGTAAGWTPKLLREGGGAELGHAVPVGLSRSSLLAGAVAGHPTGWATVAADLDLAPGDEPVKVTVTAIS